MDPAPGARVSVLFVCLGNICRSPLAEGVFLKLLDEAGLQDRFEVDSAGTGSWHVGERPDTRAQAVARRHGVELPGRARQVDTADLEVYDWVVAMDRENLHALEHLRGSARARARVVLLRDFDPEGEGDVPDPYYGGEHGFERVFEIVSRSCRELLEHLIEEHGLDGWGRGA
ncbi:MAG TPA: low molecular weight protein-tyrosine-phosphatase [Longimicrobiales bacterium]|nr:low molecular weight protein-tyrosine-phosphatase [Longimicrobiales bacterium]